MATIPELIADLEASTLEELLDDDPMTEPNWNQAVRCIKNLTSLVKLVKEWDCPAIGGKYVRYPGVEQTIEGITAILPEDPEPATRWPGTVWENIGTFFSGSFFRVEGGKARGFGLGPQNHALEQHHHVGSFVDQQAGNVEGGTGGPFGVGGFGGVGDVTDANTDDDETRPLNHTIQIYRRTA